MRATAALCIFTELRGCVHSALWYDVLTLHLSVFFIGRELGGEKGQTVLPVAYVGHLNRAIAYFLWEPRNNRPALVSSGNHHGI